MVGSCTTNLFLPLLLLALAIGQSSCDRRFSAEPVFGEYSAIEPLAESVEISQIQPTDFSINDAIQYLKIYERMNWEELTEEELMRWNEEFPENAMILELTSDFYLSHGDIDQALSYNSKAESHGAQSVDFYKKRSKIFAAKDDYGLAIDYINKAVAINGSDPDIYLSKGEVYLKFGDSLSALTNKRHAFSNDSTRLDIAADLAYLFAHNKESNKAFEIIKWLEFNNYKPVEMSNLKASLYRQVGNSQLANKQLGDLLAQGETEAGLSLLKFFRQKNKYDSIIHYATKILELDSLSLPAMEAKAFSFDRKGYFSSALLYYNQMLNIDSLNEEALKGVRKVNGKIAYLRQLREQREAIPTFDFASPDNKKRID